ncbi:TetR/AcrR family transcriptional regulator [Compostimonas suwonensis]|uniref:AcrR family transcriptional regulator n=1 Tax=Compostimonas suwonensis TaxID=1048394 RepID=A0A2M9C3L7_9MICO|nr:TetR/AcrR family transcriptional regulator [Compostimonas suwonensis]PJJ65108.1 AcrR family transcriptional regulator [Compostimonas suwonensis]
MGRLKVYDERLRRRLIDRTTAIIGAGGISALTLRGLALAEETSTSAIYDLFGGKDALLAEIYSQGFRDLHTSQSAVALRGVDDPIAAIWALVHEYWNWGRTNAHLYSILFLGSLGAFEPTMEMVELAMLSKTPLIETVGEALASNSLVGDPAEVADSIWVVVHGATTLANTMGPLYIDRAMLDRTMRATIDGFRPDSP